MDHNEDIDKEIRISLSIFWDIAIQGWKRGYALSIQFLYLWECQSKELNLHDQFALCCVGSYMFAVTFYHFIIECNRGLLSMIFYV